MLENYVYICFMHRCFLDLTCKLYARSYLFLIIKPVIEELMIGAKIFLISNI